MSTGHGDALAGRLYFCVSTHGAFAYVFIFRHWSLHFFDEIGREKVDYRDVSRNKITRAPFFHSTISNPHVEMSCCNFVNAKKRITPSGCVIQTRRLLANEECRH